MRNTTRILKGILETSAVQVDLYLDTASIECTTDKYYLYAVLELKDSGYEFDFTLARKTSVDVSAETLKILPLKEKHNYQIADHILEAMDQAKAINQLQTTI